MEDSEPSVQFHFDNAESSPANDRSDGDEPLLQIHSKDDDDEPLLQVNTKERGAETKDSSKPLVQYGLQDYNDSTPTLQKETHVQYIFTKGGFLLKVALISLFVIAAAALVIAFLGLAIGAAGLQKGTQTVTTTQAPLTKPTTTSESKPTTSSSTKSPPVLVSNSNCGSGLWMKVAYLNMSDPTQECPRGWRGYSDPVRCCGRPVVSRSSSASVYYSTNGFQYSKVCGRAIGYQQGSPDCFANINNRGEPDTDKVDGIYVDGVSVTYGNPRSHIWTFAMGLHERSGGADSNNCPCDGGIGPPAFVGNNYFCETGDDTPSVEVHRFFGDDPLWDGQNCNNITCCAFNSPPWFKVQLPSSTMDNIEVRICGDQSTGDEDSPISYLEIYVQQ